MRSYPFSKLPIGSRSIKTSLDIQTAWYSAESVLLLRKQNHLLSMIIKDESEINEKMEDIYASQKALFLYHHESGNLVIQNRWASSFYLAYLDGHWYSSCNKKKGGSDNRRAGNFLILALDNIWYMAPRKRNLAEFSTPKSPLSKDHHTFILFCHKMKIYLVVADGTKAETFIYEEFHATPKLWKILSIEHVRSRLLFELNKHIPSNDHERQEVLIPIMAYALIVSNEYNWDTVKRRIQADKIRMGPHKRNVYPYNHWKHVDPYSIKHSETPPKSDTFIRCISALKYEINVSPYTALCDTYYIAYAYTLLKNYDFLVRCEDIAKIGLFLRRILTDAHNSNTPMDSLIRMYIANHLDNILLRSYALCDTNYMEALFSKTPSNHLLSHYYNSNNENTFMYLVDTCTSLSHQDSHDTSLGLQFEENYDSWTFSTTYHNLIKHYTISDEDLNLLLDFYLDRDILPNYANLVDNTKMLTKSIINYSNKGHVIPNNALSDAMVDLALWLFKRRKVHLILHIKYGHKGKWHGIPRVRRTYIS